MTEEPENLTEEEEEQLYMDAVMGQILWSFLDKVEEGKDFNVSALEMMDEVNEFLDQAQETVH